MRKTFLQPTIIEEKDFQYINRFIPQIEPQLSSIKEVIKVCEPALAGNEEKYLLDCLKSGWISSLGTYVSAFEHRFAEYTKTKYAVSVTNGTTALHLALAALGIKKGDEVIVPTFTMIATANAVKYVGATPVFVDARYDTWNIDELKIEEAITPKTKAIIVVHTYGHAAEMDTITEIAKKHNLWVIEDAAEAHGALYKDRPIGSLGDIACFSFYANKLITTGEGGIVTTSSEDFYKTMYKLHNHAFADNIHFWHEYLGFNFRMTNLQAALGCAQLEKIDVFLHKKRKNAKLYLRHLRDVEGIILPVEKERVLSSYWMFGIVLQDDYPISRDQLRILLAENGIETRTFFIPMHFQPVYYKREDREKFPVANYLCQRGLYLPSAVTLSEKQIEYICSIIKSAR